MPFTLFLRCTQEKGYFKEQGIEVEIQMPADTNDPLKLVAANKSTWHLAISHRIVIARGSKYSC